ncbi:hypothetical protein POM88_023254 [Heracleum sosnowskyi]|uniref:F-box domain-containing protein n=1 Tax=Heracleum sosnowskyi TaxID=360622 RepID=A0AAD8MUE9_9APIA|nr:hypothetical protein POM88_023254 [Heracleum sosnowskyi]
MEQNKEVKLSNEQQHQGEDRLSNLPDDLIHRILSFTNAQSAVQTSVLSKRWKLIWTTLPYLNFTSSRYHFIGTFSSGLRFICLFLSNRNHDSQIHTLNLAYEFPLAKLVDMLITYAMLSNAEELNFDIPGYGLDDYGLSTFSSTSIKKLSLRLHFSEFPETDCWDLPALETLHLALAIVEPDNRIIIPESNLICLPSLRTLVLDGLQLPDSLVSLEIIDTTSTTTSHSGPIIVLAPKIRNFSSVGFFPITFGVCELENVNIKLLDSTENETPALSKKLKSYTQVIHMFPGMSCARILTLDSGTIEALSSVSKFLAQFPSPFYQLKHVKVPQGHNESSLSTDLKRYILGRSPKATIVTILPQASRVPLYCILNQARVPIYICQHFPESVVPYLTFCLQ